MKSAQRQALLQMAERISQQTDYKIPDSYFSGAHILTSVSYLMMMSFVLTQLLELLAKSNKVPTNFNEDEQRMVISILEKIKYPSDPAALKTFLKAVRMQLSDKTRQFNDQKVAQEYSAKNHLVKLYDHLLRETLILHPDFPALVAVAEIPTHALESLLGFYFIEIEIKHTVEVNDALSPNFRTLLAIWQNPDALKTPMTLAGMAAQHIDWTNSLSWIGVLSTLALATPPSIKAFVNKSEYQGLVFSKDLCQLLTPEIKFKPEVERIKKMTALLRQSTENLHLALLREHGLSEQVSESKKKEHLKEDKEQDADLTLTFAESAISGIATQHRSTLKPATIQLTTALDNYLTTAIQHISLGILARRINRWYENASIPTMEHLLKSTVPTPRPTTAMTSASSASTVLSTSPATSQSLSQSLSQTILGTSTKPVETDSSTSTVTSPIAIKKRT